MGKLPGRETRTPISPEDIRKVQVMHLQLSQVRLPLLQRSANPHEYLYFAFLDGTGQNKNDPARGPQTTIGALHDQAERSAADTSLRIGAGYTAGIGSQGIAPARMLDGALAFTWREGIEKAYRQLSLQAMAWRNADPHAQIRVVGIGYSRGAVQTTGLLRLIDRYGIVSHEGLQFGTDAHGNITVRSRAAPLIPPGQTIQAAMLLDPVATNMPDHYDARLPPSVISRIAVMAADEKRTLFPHQAIVASTAETGADGISARLLAPGGHSNVGGGNTDDGLEILTANLVIGYLNQLSDRPLFHPRKLPLELEDYTRYQAGGATTGFGLAMDRDGQRDLREELSNCIIVEPCRASEPVDIALMAPLQWSRYQQDPLQARQLQELGERVQHQARLQVPEVVAEAVRAADPDVTLEADVHAREQQAQRALPGRNPPLFVQALAHLQRLEPEQVNHADDRQLQQLAGGIALQAARRRLPSIDEIVPGDQGQLHLIHHSTRHPVFDRYLQVDAMAAAQQPLQESLQRVAEQMRLQALEQMPQDPQPDSPSQGMAR